MTTRAGNMNGKIILTDQDNGAVGYSLLIQGTVEGLAVSNVSTGIVQVAIGRAVLLATRTSVTPNQKFLSHVEVTVAENVSITTGFVWLELIQSYINDGSTITATNGVGVARINSGSAYPSTNYLPLASITGGVITDARVFITGKAILQKGLTANSVKENNATGDEVLKTVGSGSSIISTETLRKKKADGNYEDIAWSTFKSDITSAI